MWLTVRHLLFLEWLKVRPTVMGRISLWLYVVGTPLLLYTIVDNLNVNAPGLTRNSLVQYPMLWDIAAYTASWLTFFILTFLSISLVTNEFEYRTLRQTIINGIERQQYWAGKLLFVVVLSGTAALYAWLVALSAGLIITGGVGYWGHGLGAIGRLWIQGACFSTTGLTLGLLLRRTGLVVFVFFPYVLFVERIVRYTVFKGATIGTFLPANAFNDLVPFPAAEAMKIAGTPWRVSLTTTEATVTALTYLGLLTILGLYLIRKKDL